MHFWGWKISWKCRKIVDLFWCRSFKMFKWGVFRRSLLPPFTLGATPTTWWDQNHQYFKEFRRAVIILRKFYGSGKKGDEPPIFLIFVISEQLHNQKQEKDIIKLQYPIISTTCYLMKSILVDLTRTKIFLIKNNFDDNPV